MEKIRAFIAIELPDNIKQSLIRLQNSLKMGCRTPVRWVNPNATHLTLQFLGDVDAGLVPKITDVMTEAVSGIHPFHLSISNLGVFPDLRRVRVVWIGLNGEMAVLGNLQKRVESVLIPLGINPEARSFTPHLTLGRVRDNARPDERQALGDFVSKIPSFPENQFVVNSVHLIRSQLRPEGPLYTIIGSAELK